MQRSKLIFVDVAKAMIFFENCSGVRLGRKGNTRVRFENLP